MSTARRTGVKLTIGGVCIGDDACRDIQSLTYTDCEDGEADDLSVTLTDTGGRWLEKWMDAAIQASAAYGIDGKGAVTLGATITRKDWTEDGDDQALDCGTFTLDSASHKGPPGVITLRGTALSYASGIRQEARSQAWESYSLSGIAGEIAGRGGLSLMYLSDYDPSYEREEQSEVSDIVFLQDLCDNAGLSLKITDGQLVVLDQQVQEAQEPVGTIERSGNGVGQVISWNLSTGECDTQYGACRVSYYDPLCKDKEELKTATYTDPDAGDGDIRYLNVRSRCGSAGEAEALAKRLLRLKNKFEYTASLTVPGNPIYLAGLTVRLSGFGAWNGKYLILRATHSVGSGGYTTSLELRRCLEGY